MNFVFLCLLGLVLGISGSDSGDVPLKHLEDFPSIFLGKNQNAQDFMGLMKTHFDASLDFLFASKYYGNQAVERPGIAKLLAGESDRHWEEGMDTLKKYLQLGGVTYKNTFKQNMAFKGENDLPKQRDAHEVTYRESLKTVMEKSRNLVNAITELNNGATHKVEFKGDADVAHFLQDKAKEESEVARKMAGHYITLVKMNSTIALGIFDKEL